MPARFAPSSLVPIASLLLLAGLASSSVWGGPPAEAEQPVAEQPGPDPTADPAASATDPGTDAPAPPALDEGGASVPGASSLRAEMESGMSEIGELAVEAR